MKHCTILLFPKMQQKSFIPMIFYVHVYAVIKRNAILFFTKINFGYRFFLCVIKSCVKIEFG